LLHSLRLVYKSMRGMMTNSIDRDFRITRQNIACFFFFLISPWVGIEPATHASLGCDSRINAKAIRMRKVVKCERFARIGILELHFRLRTPKSANGTLRVVHYHSQVLCVVCKFNSNISNLTSEITSNLK
jgi:hypothetical protein